MGPLRTGEQMGSMSHHNGIRRLDVEVEMRDVDRGETSRMQRGPYQGWRWTSECGW